MELCTRDSETHFRATKYMTATQLELFETIPSLLSICVLRYSDSIPHRTVPSFATLPINSVTCSHPNSHAACNAQCLMDHVCAPDGLYCPTVRLCSRPKYSSFDGLPTFTHLSHPAPSPPPPPPPPSLSGPPPTIPPTSSSSLLPPQGLRFPHPPSPSSST